MVRHSKLGRRGRPSRLQLLPLRELQAEIERRQAALTHLSTEREHLIGRLLEIDSIFQEHGVAPVGAPAASMGAPAPKRRGRPPKSAARVGGGDGAAAAAPGRPRRGRRGKRPRNEMNLVDALRQVLNGKTLSVTDVAQAVQDAGYKTVSPNFRTIVNQALLTNRGTFTKVSRGMYTAKK